VARERLHTSSPESVEWQNRTFVLSRRPEDGLPTHEPGRDARITSLNLRNLSATHRPTSKRRSSAMASGLQVPYMRGVSDRAGFLGVLPERRLEYCLPLCSTASASPRVHCLRNRAWISRLNTQPARVPVNALPSPLRAMTRDSGSVWFATPLPYDSFIHYTSPV
jgi:hypothetical protein